MGRFKLVQSASWPPTIAGTGQSKEMGHVNSPASKVNGIDIASQKITETQHMVEECLVLKELALSWHHRTRRSSCRTESPPSRPSQAPHFGCGSVDQAVEEMG